MLRRFGFALALAFLIPKVANATAETDALFRDGTAALDAGRPAQAIADFEALADRGVVDAVASYDRGLAYAMRVRLDAEVPGDLGRAAHGFEEARSLTDDPALSKDAQRALAMVRTEVARRRARVGEPIEVDPGVPLIRAASALLPEDGWLYLAVFASLVIAAGLFARASLDGRRSRVAGVVSASVATVVVAVSVLLASRARADRLHLREAVIVAPSARSCDSHGVATLGNSPLPEAARVEILSDDEGSFTHVRFATAETWVPTSTLREILRPE